MPLAPCPADNPSRPIYVKGLVAEVSKFLFGEGFAITGGNQWRVRRRAVGPALHRWGPGRVGCGVGAHGWWGGRGAAGGWANGPRFPWSRLLNTHRLPPPPPPPHPARRAYLEVMLDRVFGESALHLNKKLDAAAASGGPHDCPVLCLAPNLQPFLPGAQPRTYAPSAGLAAASSLRLFRENACRSTLCGASACRPHSNCAFSARPSASLPLTLLSPRNPTTRRQAD